MAKFAINSKAKPRTYAKNTPFPAHSKTRFRPRMDSSPPESEKIFGIVPKKSPHEICLNFTNDLVSLSSSTHCQCAAYDDGNGLRKIAGILAEPFSGKLKRLVRGALARALLPWKSPPIHIK
jgi:hypothetical protein